VNSSRRHPGGGSPEGDAPVAVATDPDGGVVDADSEAINRLGAIEGEIAFQGDTLRELGDALATQQMDVLALQQQVRLLGEQLAALRADVSRAAHDGNDDEPPPPHY